MANYTCCCFCAAQVGFDSAGQKQPIEMKTIRIITTIAALLLATCASIPYRASFAYDGITASYDGKRVLLDVNGNEVARNLRGYAK